MLARVGRHRTNLSLRLSKRLRPPFISRSSFACFSVRDYSWQCTKFNTLPVYFKDCSSKMEYKQTTCLAESMLRGEIYCVLTSHATPLSVGRSFLLMPSFLTGVTATSSRNNSSSSGASGGLGPGGGLIQQIKNYKKRCSELSLDKILLMSLRRLGLLSNHTCIHWGQEGQEVSQDLAQQKASACNFSLTM